eukprot:TRINITY_DN6052_c0_g1_i2.p1 TRINITY_DN6052_c0_g1~~TRINITY_DN6052_c0_g1_i2.p1  ORF type:complete len:237 (+),score=55.36 TRINITY_DN6052_c0_g1_i2:57-767(+)
MRAVSLVVLLVLQNAGAREQEMTVEVGAGKEECFYESVQQGHTLTIDYQVVDAGSGQYAELDINFRVMHPKGHPIVATFKKPDGSFNQRMEEVGDYKICFDNTFSFVSSKTVYFELINENEEEPDYDDLAGIFPEDGAALDDDDLEFYEVQVADIEARLKKIKEEVDKSKHLQDLIRVTDTKDRSIAEHNFERVNFMSFFYMIVLISSGLLQVLLIRSLFDDKSKINPLWKKAFKD